MLKIKIWLNFRYCILSLLFPYNHLDKSTLEERAKTDLMGSLDFPKRRLRSFQVKATDVSIHHGTKTMQLWPWKHEEKTDDGDTIASFNSEEIGDLIITFDSRKLLVSQEHEDNFHHSVFWHKKNEDLKIKLRRPNSALCTPWPGNSAANSTSIEHRDDIRDTLDRGLELPLDYRCVLCSRWHEFELMYKPQYSPRNLGLGKEEKKKVVPVGLAHLDSATFFKAAYDLGIFVHDNDEDLS